MYKDRDFEMLPQPHQGVMNYWHILKKLLEEEEIVRYFNGWNPLSCKPQIKKVKKYHSKKRETSKEEAPVASTSKPQANQHPQEGENNKKIIGGSHIPQVKGSQKFKKMPWEMSLTWPDPLWNSRTKKNKE
ncbi:hypothetical protein O181_039206 [Austropuccinia psidii MF-1]|uniref:Uncharacterized protein n=1 Tax=Austropuccinia psidii MF-1 TaxID=1389203 RepID=A0A9Q3DFG9_9BASI|nr:hypothetical protein [Austropuccinia psidii MF-1]